MSLIILAALVLAGGCSQPFPALPALDDPALKLATPFAPVDLETFLALDETSQAQRRAAVDQHLEFVARNERNRTKWIRSEMLLLKTNDINHIVIRDPERRYDHLMRRLEQAVEIDPSHSRAWFRLGAYAWNLGDFELARRAFAMVPAAASGDSSLPQPGFLTAMAALKEAWCCRELGFAAEGLALVEETRASSGIDNLESRILYGLLLADVGRFYDAYNWAMDIDAVEIPDLSATHWGLRRIRSNYVRCWIQAMAWRGVGEHAMARHALGELRFHRRAFPFSREYWQDVGLITELSGSVDDSRLAYGISVMSKRHLVPLMNWDAFSSPPVILEQPHIRVPCYTAYDTRRLGGSLFTLGAQLLTECAQADRDSLRDARGVSAVDALTVCMRRGIRPALAHALRGRARYYLGDFEQAESDLRAARDELAVDGRGDAGTDLVLGTILVNGERYDEALEFLAAAVDLEPEMAGAWRTLGVTYATLGRNDEAEDALDRALDLDPESSLGWHNRGLFHASLERWEPAMTDLGVAVRLAPWNEEARNLMQRVALEMRDSEMDDEAMRAVARSDSLAGSISLYAEGRVETRPGVTRLGGSERVRNVAELPDFDAEAEALAAVYAEKPTVDVRRSLAEAYLHAGRSEEASALMASVPGEQLMSEDLVLLLRADRDAGDVERALALVADMGGPGDANNADLWSLAALICLDNGYVEAGRRALDRAIELDPENEGLKAYRQFLSGRTSQ